MTNHTGYEFVRRESSTTEFVVREPFEHQAGDHPVGPVAAEMLFPRERRIVSLFFEAH